MKNHDEMLQIDLCGGQARVMLCETTQTVQRCADIHECTPVCTATLGRLMTGTLMLGIMMKGKDESVTVTIKGDGPMGTLVAVADHGHVKACADDPRVEIPPREDGKLDVGGAVGHSGRMSVIKDLGMKKNYIGQSEIVSGTAVLKAGGLLIQPLPGCPDHIIDQIELRSPMFADISREMTFAPIEQLCRDWFRGMEPKILERTPLGYRCTCSRNRMEKALISLGKNDLQSLADDKNGAELVCHFCRSRYMFTTEELENLIRDAETKTED